MYWNKKPSRRNYQARMKRQSSPGDTNGTLELNYEMANQKPHLSITSALPTMAQSTSLHEDKEGDGKSCKRNEHLDDHSQLS